MNRVTGLFGDRSQDGGRRSARNPIPDGGTEAGGSHGQAVTVENLTKTYGEDGVQAVSGIDFEIEKGTAVGVLGPNGAGKTTTLKCLIGLIDPTAGEVRIDGIDVRETPKLAYRRIGVTFEGARNIYWRLTVRENLDFFAALAGNDPNERRERHEQLLSQFDMTEKADTVVRELSRGQKQKTAIACALARNSDVLFLDEPTLGLDVESSIKLRRELSRLVEDDETTVVLSSHDMDVIEYVCDRVIIMNDGEVVTDDTVEKLLHVFDTKRYEVRVTGELTPQIRDELEAEYGVDEFETHDELKRFEASVSRDGFYAFTEYLKDAGLLVESINTVDADLEEAFLKITDTDPDDAGEGVPPDDGPSANPKPIDTGGSDQ